MLTPEQLFRVRSLSIHQGGPWTASSSAWARAPGVDDRPEGAGRHNSPTHALRGVPPEEAEELARRFKDMLASDEPPDLDPGDLGKLEVIVGVRDSPTRVKRATLTWHTFLAALEGRGDAVVTRE